LTIGGTVGTGISVIDGPAEEIATSLDDSADKVASGVDDTLDTSVNRTQVERAIHSEINDRREANGLRPIDWDSNLQEIARYHSRDMAQGDYFAHTSPGGETMEDRYSRFGYNCQVSTGGNTYVTGAENIAYTFAGTDIMRENGDTINHNYDEQEIAEGIVNQWMNSAGHRENILRSYWRSEAIGVYLKETDGKTKVYATQNFC
jgi:uncharacterized protein YkwD